MVQSRGRSALFNLHQHDSIGIPITRIIRPSVFSRYLRDKKFDQALEFKLMTRTLKLNISPFGKGSFLLSAIDVTERRLLDDMRRDFIANASHELRTPLTVITGYIETMREMKGDFDGLPLDRVEQQTERMRTLLEELMTLTRLEEEERPDSAEPVDIAALLEDVYQDALSIDKGRHNIRLTTEPASLDGNREELRTAFMNLVTNAIRYTPEQGSIRIFCNTDKQGIHVGVEDKGIGISQQHIGRLTERFYRVDTGRSRENGGTGLGLAIVKHALDRHGGKLHIHSVLGLGSLFRCRRQGHWHFAAAHRPPDRTFLSRRHRPLARKRRHRPRPRDRQARPRSPRRQAAYPQCIRAGQPVSLRFSAAAGSASGGRVSDCLVQF